MINLRARLRRGKRPKNADDSAENYKFVVVGRGPRRKVIKIKRKNPVV